MSLFSYQGSLCVAISAATSLLYQALFCLSRTFLTFFKSFFDILFELTQRVLILSLICAIVKNFFYFFEFLFWRNSFTLCWPYKLCPALRTTVWQLRRLLRRHAACSERRKRDLNPRAGFPTYTLSRGASSASWVFLLITVANNHLLNSGIRQTHMSLYKRKNILSIIFLDKFIYFFLYPVMHKMCYFWGFHFHILVRQNGLHVVNLHFFPF